MLSDGHVELDHTASRVAPGNLVGTEVCTEVVTEVDTEVGTEVAHKGLDQFVPV